jgi:predicted transcriptional regulator
MNNAVLISIKPQWCFLIEDGLKTYEVRKTKPRLKPPFTCYIYCTKSGRKNLLGTAYGTGSVIGEFTCDKIFSIGYDFDGCRIDDDLLLETMLDRVDINIYANGKTIYCWHISDFKRYDKPKPLSDFFHDEKCHSCKVSGYESSSCIYDNDCYVPKPIKRPPQSYCLVEKNYMTNNL